MESMKRMITGQGLEESEEKQRIEWKRLGEAEDKEKCEGVTTPDNSSTQESRNGKDTAERNSSEDMGHVIEIGEGHIIGLE